MLRISESVDGATVAPATPSGAARERGEHRRDAEQPGAPQQQPPAADAVAERAHGDE
jgi:hypothetical protein